MKIASWLLVLLGLCGWPHGAAAAPELQSQDKNLEADRADVNKFIDGLGSGDASVSGRSTRETYAGLARKGAPVLTTSDFDRFGKDPAVTAHALGNAAVWSAIAAQAVGTAEQMVQAKFLGTQGAALAGSSNADLAKAGSLLTQQAAAVAGGDKAGAAGLARAVASIPTKGFDPRAVLSSSQQAQVAELQDVTGYDWGSTGLALGQTFLAGVLGFLQGGPIGAGVAVGLSLASSLLTGSFTAQTHSIAGRSDGRNAGSVASWSGQAGATLVGGQTGNYIQSHQGPAQVSSSGNLPVLNSNGPSAENVQIKPSGGSAAGSVLPGSK